MGYQVFVDGGSRGNPGLAGCGVVIQDQDGNPVFEAAYFLGHQTNNAAEYYGLIHALDNLQRLEPADTDIFADSQLLVRQITGEYRVKNPKLQTLFNQAQFLLIKLPRWSIQHVYREANGRADELANVAMDRGENVIEFDPNGIGSETSVADETPEPPAPAEKSEPITCEETEPAGQKRTVRVKILQKPQADTCPAGGFDCDHFDVTTTLPEGLCIYAAHAILPTVLAMQGTSPKEFAGIPAMTVRCTHPDCGANFQLSPVRSANGKH